MIRRYTSVRKFKRWIRQRWRKERLLVNFDQKVPPMCVEDFYVKVYGNEGKGFRVDVFDAHYRNGWVGAFDENCNLIRRGYITKWGIQDPYYKEVVKQLKEWFQLTPYKNKEFTNLLECKSCYDSVNIYSPYEGTRKSYRDEVFKKRSLLKQWQKDRCHGIIHEKVEE